MEYTEDAQQASELPPLILPALACLQSDDHKKRLIEHADKALDDTKNGGRNRVAISAKP